MKAIYYSHQQEKQNEKASLLQGNILKLSLIDIHPVKRNYKLKQSAPHWRKICPKMLA